MMNYPPLNKLIDLAGSRYTLVTAVSKRARQILDENPKTSEKPVSKAIDELYNGTLKIISMEDY